MQLVPVLDLMDGQVVRGIAGRRNEYRANQSCFVQGSNPLQTACAFRERFGLKRLYVADLDAISGRQPDLRVLGELVESGFRISVDCGSVSLTTAEQLRQLDIDEIVIPLESLSDWQSVEQLIEVVPTTQLRFSIDLMRGRPMGSVGEQESIRETTERVFGFGLTKFIVLDLASVGMDGGLNTLEICQSILEMNAEAKIWTGGGIRNCEDLEGLREVCDVDGVLIASALHDGKISPAEVQRLFNS
ncbi:1-(5-phosphoribosyl)-5-[(5-phosphoribosylamino)methylideneamino] imidazole-4-carboxamide isomerase [Thalassoglobus neptunius]|uniref:1-(5-phosphoribosyl)-5-[(5-phosphoribosylamino)methylideneamino] imidazole-4-carboxamide isomerase n=1 Tax=Thalassoglobus neptunius TaxID=1938619 RepID=A0A5C5WLF4_9PLAN|nr:HisA/HisF-related TIM barrel protein [Thalassoglobus neptunius]TWT51510.1 1-(5-phosphoribosyl)-5-[(5-phosphoribosylamino)methylideneamino] imidazole-4-carboxamide isomerase [Thalassoglobus neptunius]